MRKLMLLGLAAIAALTAGTAQAQSTLRIGLWDDPDTIDPTLGRLYSGRLILNMICDKLFDVTPDLKIVPKLATGYEWSADGMALTIKLRPGVKFHDGEPFNAAAVKFSIERHLTMPASFRKSEIDVIKTVEIVDDLTVRFVLSKRSAPLLSHLTDRAGMVVSPKAAAALGAKFGTAPVCNGPLKFVQRVAQDKIVLERFPDYWDKGNVHFDQVVFVPIPDGTVRVTNLRSGQLDLIERVSPADLGALRADKRVKVVGVPELGYHVLRFNVGNGPKADTPMGKDVRIRQALEAAIDRKTLVQVVFNNDFLAGNQYVNPKNLYYNEAIPVPPRDVNRAKALLKEAGHPSYSFTLLTSTNPDWVQAAQVIQAMVAEAGFDMKIQVQEHATRGVNMQKGDFEAGFAFWSGRIDPDGNIGNHMTCKGAQNDSRYCNEKVDKLIDDARQVADPAERKKHYDAATAQLLEDRPILFLWHRMVITAHSAKLQGFVPNPDGIIRVQGMKLDTAS